MTAMWSGEMPSSLALARILTQAVITSNLSKQSHKSQATADGLCTYSLSVVDHRRPIPLLRRPAPVAARARPGAVGRSSSVDSRHDHLGELVAQQSTVHLL